jgi:hypothetical protein
MIGTFETSRFVIMNHPKGKEVLKRIQNSYAENGLAVDQLVPLLKELRPYAIEIENPLLVKIIRMTYEHLEEYNDFLIRYVDDSLGEEVNDFGYLLQLIADPDNKYNKEDLQEYRDRLKMYPDVPVEEPEESEEDPV